MFQGGLKAIKRDTPIVFSEMLRKWSAKFDYHPNEIISLLSDIGYDCFVVKNGGLEKFVSMDESTKETNFFFLHHNKQAVCFGVCLL